jgi:sec-independent protein translocase protein TatA
MGSFSIWHILIVGAAALLLFGGRGKISDLMGDLGKGIKSFKIGLSEPEPAPLAPQVPRNDQIGAAVPAQVHPDQPR